MPHILLIEDNPGDARLIQELLYEVDTVLESHKITHVDRVSEAVRLLQSSASSFDVVLSDITLPDSSGAETLSSIATVATDIPVIFMTGTNNEALALDAIQQGAQDYILKGLNDGDTLARSIRYAVERQRFQRQLQTVTDQAKASQQRADLLAQQKKQLVALTKAKDEFISLASHQLRTPATAVKQYLGMIVQGYVGDINEEVFEMVQTAFDSNERQLRVINDLLKTAQLDADSYRLHIEPHDVNKLLEELLSHLQSTFEMRHQHVEFTKQEPAIVPIDHGEMYLVLDNIIGNASKYTPQHKHIRISTQRLPKKFQIKVCDEGVGISLADQKRVFEKFTRVDNALSDTVTGTGLGLYWAKRIMRLHKGSIRITSEIGKRTEFILTLPV